MEFTSQLVPHYSTHDGCVVHKISNENGAEVICTPHQTAILSIRTPDSSGALQPLLANYQQEINSYLNASATLGGILGPISFPYEERTVSIGKKTHSLPTMEDKKKFRLVKWEAAARCSEQSCKIVYRSMPSENKIPATPLSTAIATHLPSSSHTIEIELNHHNQLFTHYSSRSIAKEQFSLGHNLIWNLSGGKGFFHQQMAINASQFTTTPFAEKLLSVDQSEQDYRTQRTITEECEGYYKIHRENITNAQYQFEQSVENLAPAVMLSDPHSNRYLQIYTNYPCLHVDLYRHRRKRGWAISLTPCILLDMPELFVRRSRHTFRCCYQFGILR